MRRIGRVDIVLAVTLLPIWLAAFALHVHSVVETKLAQPTFFVSMPEDASAYPKVRGFRFETSGAASQLRFGDRLLAIGERDLRGVGHIGVDAIAIAEADQDYRIQLTYETVRLDLKLHTVPSTAAHLRQRTAHSGHSDLQGEPLARPRFDSADHRHLRSSDPEARWA
jgi:hypothetical protein